LEYGNFGNVSPSLLDVYQNIITRERESEEFILYNMGNLTGVHNFIYCIASSIYLRGRYDEVVKNTKRYESEIDELVAKYLRRLRRNKFKLNPLDAYMHIEVFNKIIQSEELYYDPIIYKEYVEVTLGINIIFLEQTNKIVRRIYGKELIPVPKSDLKMIIVLKNKPDESIYRCESIIYSIDKYYNEFYESVSESTKNFVKSKNVRIQQLTDSNNKITLKRDIDEDSFIEISTIDLYK